MKLFSKTIPRKLKKAAVWKFTCVGLKIKKNFVPGKRAMSDLAYDHMALRMRFFCLNVNFRLISSELDIAIRDNDVSLPRNFLLCLNILQIVSNSFHLFF